jgi:hypothetical protein
VGEADAGRPATVDCPGPIPAGASAARALSSTARHDPWRARACSARVSPRCKGTSWNQDQKLKAVALYFRFKRRNHALTTWGSTRPSAEFRRLKHGCQHAPALKPGACNMAISLHRAKTRRFQCGFPACTAPPRATDSVLILASGGGGRCSNTAEGRQGCWRRAATVGGAPAMAGARGGLRGVAAAGAGAGGGVGAGA